MDRLERIVVLVSLVFVMSLAVIAQDERDALATKIDEIIGAGHAQREADLCSRVLGAWKVWRRSTDEMSIPDGYQFLSR